MTKEGGFVSRRVRQLNEHCPSTTKLSFAMTPTSRKSKSSPRDPNIDESLPSSHRVAFNQITPESFAINDSRSTGPTAIGSRKLLASVLEKHKMPFNKNTLPHRVTARERAPERDTPGSRRQQDFCHPVPSVIYLRSVPQRFIVKSAAPVTEGATKSSARLELDHGLRFHADVSTISAAPSEVSLPNTVDDAHLEQVKSSKEMVTSLSEESDSNEEGANHLEGSSSRLNPNAPIFVPTTEQTVRSSPSSALTRVFCRTSFKPDRRGGKPFLRCMASFQSPRIPTPLSPTPLHRTTNQRFSTPNRFEPKVTVLSEELKIFVVDLLKEEACDWILYHTEQHVEKSAALGTETWRKLFTHTQFDLPCCEVLPIRPLTDQLLIQIRQIVGNMFKSRRATSRLAPRSWKEPHLLRYQKIPGKPAHTGMIMHYDGGHMTWQLMLSTHRTDYAGESSLVTCASWK